MGVMRKRIKPIVVYVVLALLGLALVIANIHNTSKQQAHLQNVKSAIPYATTPKTTTSSTSSSSDEELKLNPIIDLSGVATTSGYRLRCLVKSYFWCYRPRLRWITD